MTGVQALIAAVRNKGPNPELHDYMMAKHRLEWPVLWNAIDQILQENE